MGNRTAYVIPSPIRLHVEVLPVHVQGKAARERLSTENRSGGFEGPFIPVGGQRTSSFLLLVPFFAPSREIASYRNGLQSHLNRIGFTGSWWTGGSFPRSGFPRRNRPRRGGYRAEGGMIYKIYNNIYNAIFLTRGGRIFPERVGMGDRTRKGSILMISLSYTRGKVYFTSATYDGLGSVVFVCQGFFIYRIVGRGNGI